LSPRDIAVVARFEIRRTLRSPHGLLFLALFGSFFAWVGIKVHDLTSGLGGISDSGVRAAALSEDNPFFAFAGWLTDLDADRIRALVIEHPPALVALFFISLVATPFLAMMGSFDQTGTDIQTKHTRYLLLRTDRTSLYVGKSLGNAVFIAAAFAVATFGVGAVVLLTGGPSGVSVASAFVYLARIWLSLVFLTLPFVALLGFANAAIGHGFLSLVSALGLYFVIWATTAIGGIAVPAMDYVAYGFPSALKYHIMSPDARDILVAIAHQGAFAVVLFWLGLTIFRRRDV